MNRRAALIALTAFCLVIPACAKADKRINKANLAKIKVGMTRDEVEAILGPGQEIEGAAGFGSSGGAAGIGGTLDTVTTKVQKETRYGNEYTNITIIYDRADKVKDGANTITSTGLK